MGSLLPQFLRVSRRRSFLPHLQKGSSTANQNFHPAMALPLSAAALALEAGVWPVRCSASCSPLAPQGSPLIAVATHPLYRCTPILPFTPLLSCLYPQVPQNVGAGEGGKLDLDLPIYARFTLLAAYVASRRCGSVGPADKGKGKGKGPASQGKKRKRPGYCGQQARGSRW